MKSEKEKQQQKRKQSKKQRIAYEVTDRDRV